MVNYNLNSTTSIIALALGKFAVKTKIFNLFRISTEISEGIKFLSRTLPKNAATDSLAILHFTTSLLLAIYSYHKAIKTKCRICLTCCCQAKGEPLFCKRIYVEKNATQFLT